MTPQEFARRYFGEYKERGNEIIPKFCPYCKGGDKGDRETFALNTEKLTFNCKRGSCNVSGTFSQLCRDFGETAEKRMEWIPRPKKDFQAPKTQAEVAGEKVAGYLQRRGFSRETWERRGIKEYKGNIAIPYYEDGKLVLMKFRKPKSLEHGERKAWREPGGKPVFWGMDLCDPSLPLVITEGEFDALALEEAGVPNAVSVPNGAEDLNCVDLCWEWLQQFRKIIIWPDNDEPGLEMCRKLVTKLGAWRCYVVHSEHKDANEVLLLEGRPSIRRHVEEAKEVPIQGLVRLADVKAFDPGNAERVLSRIGGIDRVFGGFLMGQVSIWTGVNSSGKSTLLGQLMIEAIEQGFSVCAYSGELPAALFRYWIDLQAAGPDYLEARYDSVRQKEIYAARSDVVSYIRDWYRDKFFLYDSFGETEQENLLEVFDYAAMRYDCKVFLIDNLMTIVAGDDDRKYYRKQSEFVGQVIQFAHRHNVHVHLVAHPRKTNGRLTKMDVYGSGDVTNRPDNVLAVHRIKDDERPNLRPELKDCANIVDIFKNRFGGWQDVEIGLMFDERSKRFYMPSDQTKGHRQYGWINLLKGNQGTAPRAKQLQTESI